MKDDKAHLYVVAARCTGCEACVRACPEGAITIEAGIARVDQNRCTGCGACIQVCLQNAIQEEITVVEGEIVPVEPARVGAAIRQGPSTLGMLAGTALAYVGREILPWVARSLDSTVGQRLSSSGGRGEMGTAPRPGGHRRRGRRRGR